MSIGGVAIYGRDWYVYISSDVVRDRVRVEVGFIWNMAHVLKGDRDTERQPLQAIQYEVSSFQGS